MQSLKFNVSQEKIILLENYCVEKDITLDEWINGQIENCCSENSTEQKSKKKGRYKDEQRF